MKFLGLKRQDEPQFYSRDHPNGTEITNLSDLQKAAVINLLKS